MQESCCTLSVVRGGEDLPERDAVLRLAAVSVDGVTTLRLVSRRLDPAGGWFTAAAPDRPQAPFDQPFSLILNLAVGGDWPGGPDASTPFPATMLVDYARVVARLE